MLRTRIDPWQRAAPAPSRLVSSLHAARRVAGHPQARRAAPTATRGARAASLASGSDEGPHGSGRGGDGPAAAVGAEQGGACAASGDQQSVLELEAALRRAADDAEARQAAFAERLAAAGALGAHRAGVLAAYAAIQREANDFMIRGRLLIAADAAASRAAGALQGLGNSGADGPGAGASSERASEGLPDQQPSDGPSLVAWVAWWRQCLALAARMWPRSLLKSTAPAWGSAVGPTSAGWSGTCPPCWRASPAALAARRAPAAAMQAPRRQRRPPPCRLGWRD